LLVIDGDSFTHLAHITAFRSRSFGAVARVLALSSALPTCCCDSTDGLRD